MAIQKYGLEEGYMFWTKMELAESIAESIALVILVFSACFILAAGGLVVLPWYLVMGND